MVGTKHDGFARRSEVTESSTWDRLQFSVAVLEECVEEEIRDMLSSALGGAGRGQESIVSAMCVADASESDVGGSELEGHV